MGIYQRLFLYEYILLMVDRLTTIGGSTIEQQPSQGHFTPPGRTALKIAATPVKRQWEALHLKQNSAELPVSG